jgi:hypothetical protein
VFSLAVVPNSRNKFTNYFLISFNDKSISVRCCKVLLRLPIRFSWQLCCVDFSERLFLFRYKSVYSSVFCKLYAVIGIVSEWKRLHIKFNLTIIRGNITGLNIFLCGRVAIVTLSHVSVPSPFTLLLQVLKYISSLLQAYLSFGLDAVSTASCYEASNI